MTSTPVERVDLTPLERSMLAALARCTFLPGSFEKRFVRSIGDVTALTERQRAVFYRTFYRYRRQMNLSDADARRVLDRVQGKGGYPLLEMEEGKEEEKEKKETEKPCSNVAI